MAVILVLSGFCRFSGQLQLSLVSHLYYTLAHTDTGIDLTSVNWSFKTFRNHFGTEAYITKVYNKLYLYQKDTIRKACHSFEGKS